MPTRQIKIIRYAFSAIVNARLHARHAVSFYWLNSIAFSSCFGFLPRTTNTLWQNKNISKVRKRAELAMWLFPTNMRGNIAHYLLYNGSANAHSFRGHAKMLKT